MSDVIESPDHIIVCGKRIARHVVDHQRASYGHPLDTLTFAYWPSHPQPWIAYAHVARESGVRVQYSASASDHVAAGDAMMNALSHEDFLVLAVAILSMEDCNG